MYSKKITWKQYLPAFDLWADKELRTTNDAIWLHLKSLELRSDVKDIWIMDI